MKTSLSNCFRAPEGEAPARHGAAGEAGGEVGAGPAPPVAGQKRSGDVLAVRGPILVARGLLIGCCQTPVSKRTAPPCRRARRACLSALLQAHSQDAEGHEAFRGPLRRGSPYRAEVPLLRQAQPSL